jgi:hypothetical protein
MRDQGAGKDVAFIDCTVELIWGTDGGEGDDESDGE